MTSILVSLVFIEEGTILIFATFISIIIKQLFQCYPPIPHTVFVDYVKLIYIIAVTYLSLLLRFQTGTTMKRDTTL